MCAGEQNRYEKACRKEQLTQSFLRRKFSLDILIAKVDSCQNRLIQQDMQTRGLQVELDDHPDEGAVRY